MLFLPTPGAHATSSKAAAGEGPKKKSNAAADEEELQPWQYTENRQKMVDQMEADGISAYPHKWPVDTSLPDYVSLFDKVPDGERLNETTVCIAGRIQTARPSGKLAFFDLVGDGAKIQVRSPPPSSLARVSVSLPLPPPSSLPFLREEVPLMIKPY